MLYVTVLMFWDVHMHKITFMEGRTKKQERLEIKLFKWKKQMKSTNRIANPYMRFTNYISCELAWTRICDNGVQKQHD